MAAPAGGILGMPAAVPAPAGGTFGSADALFRVEGAGAYDVVNGDYKVDVAAGLKDGAPCYIKIASREFGYGQVFHTIARDDGKWWMIESVPSQPPRMLYSVAASADDKPPPTGWGRDSCVPFGNGCFAPSAEKMALMPSIVALRAAAATLGAPAAAVPSAAAELEQQLEQLHTAVKENKLADVKALLAYVKLLSTDVKALLADVKAGRCVSSNLVNMADEKGITALVWAAAIGHGEMVRFLLEAGADKTAVTKKGNNALQAAKLGQAKTGGNARFDEVIRALESPAAFGSFGAPAAGAPSAFGAPAGGGLGATPSAFGSPAGGAFGAVAKPAFGAPTPTVFGAPTPPAFGAPSSSGTVPSLFAPKPAFSNLGGATPFGAAPAAAPAAGFSFGGTATATALAPAPSPATVSPLAPASEASSVFGPAPAPPPPLLVGSPEEAYSFGSIGVSPPSPSVGEWVLVPSPADEL
jgi:alpha/beta superfamily hydrolase